MRYLLAFVMLVVFTFHVSANENDFRLNIQRKDNKDTIEYVETLWEYVGQVSTWKLSVEKGALGTNRDKVEFHSVTIYDVPYMDSSIGSPIDKIYTYGVLNCEEKILVIFNEFYVDSQEVVVYQTTHEFGSYVVDLRTPNTIRNDILKAVCNKSI